jgi:hypothetical protein
MSFVNGVNLLPATGEFTYGTTPHQGQRAYSGAIMLPVNFYQGLNSVFPPSSTYGGTPPSADLTYAISQLQANFPGCTTVAVVCAWFGDSTDITACKIYPSTTYINGTFEKWNGSAWVSDNWLVSGLTQSSFGIIPISQDANGAFTYGGTPSDASIVECITYLKAQGYRVVFYPFILMDNGDKAWRGRITYNGADVSTGAQTAVRNFLGTAVPSNFTISGGAVHYSGSSTDYTYRRMILHYANLCVLAGGVDLFLVGSELRGLETIRGPAWSITGTGTPPTWDYPFVYDTVNGGLMQLCADVRSIFNAASLTKDLMGLHNLISYAADWSSWMGWQHPNANPALPVADGQWPHLDQLWSNSHVDLVCFDNYMPTSDWTTGDGSVLSSGQSNNLDIANWAAPAPFDQFLDYGHVTSDAVGLTYDRGAVSSPVTAQFDDGIVSAAPSWPPAPSVMSNLGLSGQATIYNKAYLKANIEGGEKFNWFYYDSNNLGRGLDPLGSGLQVSLPGYPTDDRYTQTRERYYANQQILGNKQLRWWWNNQHFALYDDGDGSGESPKGLATGWVPQSKSIVFTEYGFPSNDKCTNQPNLFYDAASSESGTAYWSAWRAADGLSYLPKQDQILALLALQAIYEYWFVDGHNTSSIAGLAMIQPAFCSVWNWDARPFPAFPNLTGVWGDAKNWPAGNWLNGKEPFITPPVPDAPYVPGPYAAFPALAGQGWSVHYRPAFTTGVAEHVSGRGSRFARVSTPIWEIEIVVNLLRMDVVQDFQTLAGFYAQMQGRETTFSFPVPAAIAASGTVLARFDDDSEDLEEFMSRLWSLQALKLRTVRQ